MMAHDNKPALVRWASITRYFFSNKVPIPAMNLHNLEGDGEVDRVARDALKVGTWGVSTNEKDPFEIDADDITGCLENMGIWDTSANEKDAASLESKWQSKFIPVTSVDRNKEATIMGGIDAFF